MNDYKDPVFPSVFVVCKEGISCSMIYFASLSEDDAIYWCNDCAEQDRDDYHDWRVYEILLDCFIASEEEVQSSLGYDWKEVYCTKKKVTHE